MILGKQRPTRSSIKFFSEVNPEVFVRQSSQAEVISQINATLFGTGVNKNYTSFSEFSRKMWDLIDHVINLTESEVFTYKTDDSFDSENPFWERGTV